MAKEIKNISASVNERLRNISVQTGKEFQSILRQYIQERFLFRLSKSNYFLLKSSKLKCKEHSAWNEIKSKIVPIS